MYLHNYVSCAYVKYVCNIIHIFCILYTYTYIFIIIYKPCECVYVYIYRERHTHTETEEELIKEMIYIIVKDT